MMRILKQIILAFIAIIAFRGLSQAHNINRVNEIYITPNVDIIFIDDQFTKSGVGFGGGVGLAVGYQINSLRDNPTSRFQIEFAINYQYYNSGERTEMQNLTDEGRAFFSNATKTFDSPGVVPAVDFIGSTSTTTISGGGEHFIPITVGARFNYLFRLNSRLEPREDWSSIAISAGIAGGLWIHHVDKTTTRTIAFSSGVVNDPDLGQFMSTTTNATATELKGVIIPSLGFSYSPWQNLTFSLAGKLHIVPGGYSGSYGDEALALTASPNFTHTTEVEEDFWYGSISFETSFSF